MVDIEDIKEAYRRIKQYINKTPVMTSRTIDRLTGCRVYFKCENFQRGGAFKFRGAMNAILNLTEEERSRGIITHSSGNHAQAVALAGLILNIKTIIVMPKTAPLVKKNATRGYGAEIIFCEPTLEAREKATNRLIDENGYAFIHPYDNDNVIAGAGTTALEFVEEIGDLDILFGPIGGGGLISGCSTAVKEIIPHSRVIGVEPSGADDAYRSLISGELIPSVNPKTIADGLLTSLSNRTFGIIRNNVDEIITVTDLEIIEAMRLLWQRMKIVVEPSGAVSLAGLIKKKDMISDSKVGVVLSGGNVDLDSFFNGFTQITGTH